MAQFPPDKAVKTVEEEELRTEEADPAETTEEEEVQTKEEAIESLLDSHPNNSLLTSNVEDEESDDENHYFQEEPIMVSRSLVTNDSSLNQIHWIDQTIDRGSTSFTSDRNRRLVPPNRSGAQTSQVMMPPEDNSGLGASRFTQNQFTRRDHTMNHQQPLPWARWFVVDHYYAYRFCPNCALWRSPIIIPLLPNQMIIPRPAFLEQNTYQQHQMVTTQMLNQTIVPGPAFVFDQNHFNQSFGMLHIDPHVAPGQAPMRPMMQQDQGVPIIVPVLAPMMPMMHQVVPNIFLGQARMRPMMYNQVQDHIVPIVVPVLAPMMPMMNNQQQQFNQGQHFGIPIDMIHHQAFPNAAAPRPQLNQQQRQPQTQQPTQSQGFNTGTSSR